ncbi:RNA-directed RNA polymerase [Fusarium beomiforme]|uniref:RNA-dependent RNA polymerase n=1 Tax=Fusarium beomiforme TaxID=44412 RepID=A0A9P5ADM8_9HYPO|nr:RNA-directed RNA polymerase [Fusarium beomiforme]
MEVLCRNVPQDLSEDNFKRELVPFMKALNITDFFCEKPKSKKQAWVKFLHPGDGHDFLERHGKIKRNGIPRKENMNPRYPFKPNLRSKDTPRLHILKTPVFVEQSSRPLDKHAIAHLKYERDKKLQKAAAATAAKDKDKDRQAPVKAFNIHGISCGGNTFRGPDKVITFVEHNSLILPGDVIGKFMPQWLTVHSEGGNRIDFHSDTIQDLIASRNDASVTLVLTEPPKMYTPHISGNRSQEWQRVQGLVTWGLIQEYSASCLVYRISFQSLTDMNEVLRSVKHRDILAITYHDLPSVLWTYMEPESHHFLGQHQFSEKARRLLASGSIHFALLFQVQALVWNNYINPASGIDLLHLLEKVITLAKQKEVATPVTTGAMKTLLQNIPYPCPGTDPRELDVIDMMTSIMDEEYKARVENPQRDRIYGAKIPDHQVYVFKAMVTPTRILLTGPDPESKNRVLRKYQENNDYFLRVIFCEEDGQDLNYHPKVDNEPIFLRFRRVMDDGITIAGRKFQFLGFSHSSLRSHSAWFSAPFTDSNFERQTPEAILRALGDFSEIRVPAKCAARIGQAFSETPYAVPIFETGITHQYIPDVKSEDGTRVFSDGVGTISREALEDIWPYLSMRAAAPTCLQIRWGGCKGMLSLDTRLKGRVFCIRKESMMKFPSDDVRELGICDASSKPLRLVLNRQMIKILEDMGTPNDWFFKLQDNALNILRNVTADATNTSYFLDYQAIGVNMGLPKLVKQLDEMGIDYRRDKFLKSAVEHVVLRELRLLKHKARIPVDKGVTLFGVMDETGFLGEGEVFVTYDKTYSVYNGLRIDNTLKDGRIIVTRSPALHPGDIQPVEQVTPPLGHPLRSLQNCIVFSQKGKRDLPSMLSGGDLDGDLYNIIWDAEASPEKYFSPADYPRVEPKPLDRPVRPKDIADFFVDFMRTDILGMIATRHVILADYCEEGTMHPDCVKLAGMHSTAVDFSKTGIPVDVKALPKNPPFRPDFLALAPPLKMYDKGQIAHLHDEDEDDNADDGMARYKTKYYPSDKILGYLYRNVDEKKIWDEDIHRIINAGGPSVWDQLLTVVENEVLKYKLDVDWTRRYEEAWKIRGLYESSITDKMWDFSENPRKPLTEVEVFCGFILNKRGAQTRSQGDSSIKLKEETDRIMTWIAKQIRDRGVGDGAETLSTATEADGVPSRWREDVVELCWAQMEVSAGGGFIGVGRGRRRARGGAKIVQAKATVPRRLSPSKHSPISAEIQPWWIIITIVLHLGRHKTYLERSNERAKVVDSETPKVHDEAPGKLNPKGTLSTPQTSTKDKNVIAPPG